jgi:hypothetical protein
LQQSRCRSDRSPMQRRSGWPTSPCFAAEILGSPCVTMTSTLSLTNSATTSVARSLRPSPQRYAIAMVRPSIRSNSCRRCTKAAVHGPAAEAVPAGGFVQWNNPVLRRWLVLAYVEPANLCVEAGAFMAFHAARSGGNPHGSRDLAYIFSRCQRRCGNGSTPTADTRSCRCKASGPCTIVTCGRWDIPGAKPNEFLRL